MYGFPHSFPLGLGGRFNEKDFEIVCRVCGAIATARESRPDGKTVFRHEGKDYCVTP